MQKKDKIYRLFFMFFLAIPAFAADSLWQSSMDYTREQSIYDQAVGFAKEIIQSLPKIDNCSVQLIQKNTQDDQGVHILRLSLGASDQLIIDSQLLRAFSYTPNNIMVGGKYLEKGCDLRESIAKNIYEKVGLIDKKEPSAFIEVLGYVGKKLGEMSKANFSYRLSSENSGIRIIEKSSFDEKAVLFIKFNDRKDTLQLIDANQKTVKEYRKELNSTGKWVYRSASLGEDPGREFAEFRREIHGFLQETLSSKFGMKFAHAAAQASSKLAIKQEQKNESHIETEHGFRQNTFASPEAEPTFMNKLISWFLD